MTDTKTAEFLTVRAFAARWRLSRRHVYKLIQAGIVPVVDTSIPGGRRRALRIPAEEADRAMFARKVPQHTV